ncbi:MAG: 23S rRNA (guanosine(2251)-2'-O)-methyltransferase RlmB [Candidatus Nanopelagicales bacterium]
MAGNSQRPGAKRKPGTKKGAVVGSGGQRKQGLEGRGPTPKAADRPGHQAHRRANASERARGASPKRGGGKPEKRPTETIAGRNAVLEALQAGVPVNTLYVQQFLDADDRVREAMKLAVGAGIALLETTKVDLDRLCGGAVHQGVVAKIPAYQYADAADLLEQAFSAGASPLLVALDGVTDPRNLGAVVRSAAAFGAHGVIVPERRAAGMTASAWKTSAGAAARLPVSQVVNLTRFLVSAQKQGCTVLGLAAAGSTELPEIAPELLTGPVVLVIGSEGKGLGQLVSQTCDQLVRIPISAATESLNASVAASVALYAVALTRR